MTQELDWCRHPIMSRPRRRVLTNGKIAYWRQCTTCGQAVGPQSSYAIAMSWAKGKPADFDEELPKRYREEQRTNRTKQREQSREEWLDWYNQYLQSDQWRELRYQVLERCQHLCEGCRMETANVVHHLTYAHAGNEFLFELVGLCQSCHDRAHRDGDKPRLLTFPLEINYGG